MRGTDRREGAKKLVIMILLWQNETRAKRPVFV